jgi:hypothetical protein
MALFILYVIPLSNVINTSPFSKGGLRGIKRGNLQGPHLLPACGIGRDAKNPLSNPHFNKIRTRPQFH